MLVILITKIIGIMANPMVINYDLQMLVILVTYNVCWSTMYVNGNHW